MSSETVMAYEVGMEERSERVSIRSPESNPRDLKALRQDKRRGDESIGHDTRHSPIGVGHSKIQSVL